MKKYFEKFYGNELLRRDLERAFFSTYVQFMYTIKYVEELLHREVFITAAIRYLIHGC